MSVDYSASGTVRVEAWTQVQTYFFRVMALAVDQHHCLKACLPDVWEGGFRVKGFRLQDLGTLIPKPETSLSL